MTAKNSRKSLPLRADCVAPKTAPTSPETVKRVGYVRVSTGEQNTDLQYDALKKAGCDPIYEDRMRISVQ